MQAVIGESKKAFMTGNEIVTWAAHAGAEIMFGYPITPQNEIMHYWTRLAPKYGREFLQTEDEISAGFTVCGAVQAGERPSPRRLAPVMSSCKSPSAWQKPCACSGSSHSTTWWPFIWHRSIFPTRGYSDHLGGNGEGHRIVYSTATIRDIRLCDKGV